MKRHVLIFGLAGGLLMATLQYTHCARAFDKLGAARRTQAVQRGKEQGLLP